MSGARIVSICAPALLLAACDGGAGPDSGPGGVSEGEARELDEAAEALDKQQLPESAIPPVDLPASEAQQPPAENAPETDQ
ncbi:MAG: hypothetical protein AAF687_09985 [Pseudomonadota bacterium]